MTKRKTGQPSRGATELGDDIADVGRTLGVLPGQSRAERRASRRAWLFLVLAVMACILLGGAILAVRSESSRTQQQAEPRADAAGEVVGESGVEQCAATDLVDVQVRMQPEERGTSGTRTLGTMTLSTGSGEALRVWVLVDEGEEGEQSWSRQGWQPVGAALSRGAPIEQRLSQTVYDDGGSTWRTITGVAAWRSAPECAELPTPAQLDEIAAPV
jgi:hypothetical protein